MEPAPTTPDSSEQEDLEAGQEDLEAGARADFWAVVRIIDLNFSNYIRGQLVLALISAALTFATLLVLAAFGFTVNYPVLLSVISGITELIPYVGFVIAVLAAFGAGALTSWTSAIAMALAVFVVKQIAAIVFYPVIVGKSVRMHETVVLVVLIVLSEFGLIWVILAPPVAGAARDLFRYIYGRLGDPPRPAGMLPDEPPAQAAANKPTRPAVEAVQDRLANLMKRASRRVR
jgi:predicted PurR-regulated permease PerM